jgi:hypothetical protein
MPKLSINGQVRTVAAPDDTPLLWVLRDELGLTGTKYGCGVGRLRGLHRAGRRRGHEIVPPPPPPRPRAGASRRSRASRRTARTRSSAPGSRRTWRSAATASPR